MNSRFIILACLLLISKNALSQDLPEIVPPSPEAAALIKHSQMDVSLYTGAPNISVPFHTISYKGVNVSVGISYNSGGIKVGDIASWAGLGWNLNAGGLVSRSIRGIPDDAITNGYMSTTYTVEDLFQRDPNSTGPGSQHWQFLDINAESRDYEPDVFNFSFPGGSGQFFYDQTLNKFVQTPYSNLKIETKTNSNGIITGFIITDTSGIKFHFGTSSNNLRTGLEQVTGAKSVNLTLNGVFNSNPSVYGIPNLYYQSWMLMDIEFPTSNETIAFDYTTETNVETTQLQNEERIHPTYFGCSPEYNIIYLNRKFTQPKIASITFPDGEITFEKSTTVRTDLRNSYPLKKIRLYDNDNKLIKGIELHTSYFTSAINTNSYFDYYNEGIYRLKLDSISQFGKNLNTLPPYKFEYDSKILPDRYARSQDYFGYYNGKNNTTLIPKAKYGLTTGYIGDADRSVDPAFTDACTLEKIIYPSGGYDQFTWENNMITAFTGNAADYVDHLTQNSAYFFNDPSLFSDPDPNIDYSKTFIISPDSDGIVEFNVMMTGCPIPTNFNNVNCDFSMQVVGITDPNFSLNIFNSNFYHTFPAGTYKVSVNSNNHGGCNPYTDPSCNNPETFSANLKWTTDPTPGELIYGGLRIAEIKTYDTPSNLALSRSFDYTNFVINTTLNSGVALNFADLSMSNYRDGTCAPSGAMSTGIKVTSNSQAQLTPTKGSLVGYKNVTETYNGSIGQGRKEYTFSPPAERTDNPYMGNGYYQSPFPSNFENLVYNDWVSGNLEKLEVYDASNNLIQKTTNEYEAASTNHAEYFGIQILRMKGDASPDVNAFITTYTYTTEWHRLKNSVTTEYLGGTPVVSTQNNYYNNNPLLASETKSTTSDGESIITKTFYPDDVTATNSLGADNLTSPEKAAIDKLKSGVQHRIAEAIQTETYKDENKNGIAEAGELLSRQRTNYREWPFNTVLPEYVQTALESNTLQNRIQFIDYYGTSIGNGNGNVKEVKKTDGTTIVYIWGYQEQYPIAKIENATYGQISSQVSNLQSKSNLDDDTCLDSGSCDEKNLRTALTTLRNSVPNAVVTTYTYDPLVGVTSVTDPKGYTMYYEYDEFNRLKQVKDDTGYVLSENEYYYKNQ